MLSISWLCELARYRRPTAGLTATVVFLLTLSSALCSPHLVRADDLRPFEKGGFVENRGQWPDEVVFLHQSPGLAVWFTRDGFVMDRFSETLEQGELKHGGALKEKAMAPSHVQGVVVRARFVGAEPAPAIETGEPLPGTTSYFLGGQAERWRSGITRCSEIRYRGVYEGIDIVYRFDRSGLKYDAIVAPGADPRAIRIRYDGARNVERTADGRLRIETAAGDLFEQPPEVFQERGGRRLPVQAEYDIREEGTVSFLLGSYDPLLPLVIDPRLGWSTFLGSSGIDASLFMAPAPDGGVFVTGFTRSPTFPTTTGAYDRTVNGLDDVFVSRFSASGQLIFSTLLGGSNNDYALAVTCDAAGNPVVAGSASSNFPTTPGAFDRTFGGGDSDAFVSKLSADGTMLLYSTFMGGAGLDVVYGVVSDVSGQLLTAGFTGSSNFPTTPDSFDPTYNGGYEGFVTVLSSDASALVQSSFFGGALDDLVLGAAQAPSGGLIVGGSTQSEDLPTSPSAYDPTFNGEQDGFLALYDISQGAIGFSTYIGGAYFEYGFTVAVDALGRPALGGETGSPDFPTSAGAFDTELAGATDAFVTKLNAAGSALVFSTYLGGDQSFDYVQGLAAAADGSVLATGATLAADFPVSSGILGGTAYAGGISDAFITVIGRRGEALAYSTCFGGSEGDAGYGVLLRNDSRVVTTGYSASPNYPTTPGAYDTSFNGQLDVYVAMLPVITGAAEKQSGSRAIPSPTLSLTVSSPTRHDVRTRLELSNAASVNLELLDSSGRRVLRRRLALPEGVTSLPLELAGELGALPSGVYFLRALTDEAETSAKVILTR